jgi:hypothetical protein
MICIKPCAKICINHVPRYPKYTSNHVPKYPRYNPQACAIPSKICLKACTITIKICLKHIPKSPRYASSMNIKTYREPYLLSCKEPGAQISDHQNLPQIQHQEDNIFIKLYFSLTGQDRSTRGASHDECCATYGASWDTLYLTHGGLLN